MAGRGKAGASRPAIGRKTHHVKGLAHLTADGSLAIDSPGLPLAPLAGFADQCSVIDRDAYLELIFTDGPASVSQARIVAAKITLAAFVQAPSTPEFLTKSKAWMDEHEMSIQPVGSERPSQLSPPLPANLFRIARVGAEGEFEAFYIPIGAIGRAVESGSEGLGTALPVVPVIRVNLPLRLLLGLVEHLQNLNLRND